MKSVAFNWAFNRDRLRNTLGRGVAKILQEKELGFKSLHGNVASVFLFIGTSARGESLYTNVAMYRYRYSEVIFLLTGTQG
jgi:hypothetical protein